MKKPNITKVKEKEYKENTDNQGYTIIDPCQTCPPDKREHCFVPCNKWNNWHKCMTERPNDYTCGECAYCTSGIVSYIPCGACIEKSKKQHGLVFVNFANRSCKMFMGKEPSVYDNEVLCKDCAFCTCYDNDNKLMNFGLCTKHLNNYKAEPSLRVNPIEPRCCRYFRKKW